MITVFYKNHIGTSKVLTPAELTNTPLCDLLWIDLSDPTPEEQKVTEEIASTVFLTRQKASEIETTSKYHETPDDIFININNYIDKGKNYETEPISFIISKKGVLVSYHRMDLLAIVDMAQRMRLRPEENDSDYGVFMTVLEGIIDYEADMEELLTREISRLSKVITSSNNIDKAILHRINELQEKTTALREDVYDMERVLSNVNRSKQFPQNSVPRISLMIKDAESLINHGDVSFARLDYLQDTAMGLINIQQNEIVKILSVAAVIFMPPTLIASIYGMNFKLMPELDWVWPLQNGWIVPAGYIFAIILMVAVTLLTYWFFRFKKWL